MTARAWSELAGAVVVTVGAGPPLLAFVLVRPARQRRGLGCALSRQLDGRSTSAGSGR